MARLIWAEPALQDLDAIADFIALDKPDAAHRLVRRVFDRVEQLTEHPRSGSVPPELVGFPYRQLVIPPVRVFYRADAAAIYILHVMRGERLLRVEQLTERDRM